MANDMIIPVVSATAGGAIGGFVAWYMKDKVKGSRNESEIIQELDEILHGDDEWFSKGIVDIIEEHDESLDRMSRKIEETERERKKLRQRIERLERSSKGRNIDMEDEEEEIE